MPYNLITVLGPTATGKTRLSANLCDLFNGEIISADSRQVYIGMDIGTGKDYQDYLTKNGSVKYHLIDIIDPAEEYSLYHFKRDFTNAYRQITSENKTPFLTGGTGLYISSVLNNYKLLEASNVGELSSQFNDFDDDYLREMLIKLRPEQHNITDLKTRDRIIKAILIAQSEVSTFPDTSFINPLVIGVNPGRDVVKKRITNRLKERLENRMIDEVKALMDKGISKERLQLFGLEYKYITLYLLGELNYNDMFQKLNSSIHAFAKRQMTWFRKMEREGTEIHWLNSPDIDEASSIIKKYYLNEEPS